MCFQAEWKIVDPDQMASSVAIADLDLQCFHKMIYPGSVGQE